MAHKFWSYNKKLALKSNFYDFWKQENLLGSAIEMIQDNTFLLQKKEIVIFKTKSDEKVISILFLFFILSHLF